jgi:hypothetical protein
MGHGPLTCHLSNPSISQLGPLQRPPVQHDVQSLRDYLNRVVVPGAHERVHRPRRTVIDAVMTNQKGKSFGGKANNSNYLIVRFIIVRYCMYTAI